LLGSESSELVVHVVEGIPSTGSGLSLGDHAHTLVHGSRGLWSVLLEHWLGNRSGLLIDVLGDTVSLLEGVHSLVQAVEEVKVNDLDWDTIEVHEVSLSFSIVLMLFLFYEHHEVSFSLLSIFSFVIFVILLEVLESTEYEHGVVSSNGIFDVYLGVWQELSMSVGVKVVHLGAKVVKVEGAHHSHSALVHFDSNSSAWSGG